MSKVLVCNSDWDLSSSTPVCTGQLVESNLNVSDFHLSDLEAGTISEYFMFGFVVSFFIGAALYPVIKSVKTVIDLVSGNFKK